MNILVILNKTPSFYIEVSKENKIKELKSMLDEYNNYKITFLINSKNELKVFETNKYDEMTLESIWKQMKNPSLILSPSNSSLILTSPSSSNSSNSPKKNPEKERAFTKNKDIDISILGELSYTDLLKACQTNTYLSQLCKDKNLWRNKLVKDFPLRSKFLWYEEYKNLYSTNPRKLYEIINSPSKIVSIDEKDFPSIKEKFPEDIYDEEFTDEDLKDLTEKNREKFNKLPLLRGDVVSLKWLAGYRNDDKLMWDGENLVELNNDIDDYGSVSKIFTFPEFSPRHFSESIDHNNIVNFTPEKSLEIKRNFDPETQTSYVTDKYNKYVIKLNTDISYLDIKFKNIPLVSHLEYSLDEKAFIFTLPFGSESSSSNKLHKEKIDFPPEWKNSIISITPKNSSTTYKWKGNILKITTIDPYAY